MVTDKRHAKIIWQCRRGMLELDLLLQRFVEKRLASCNDSDLAALEQLLEIEDPTLYAYLMNQISPENRELQRIVKLIQLSY